MTFDSKQQETGVTKKPKVIASHLLPWKTASQIDLLIFQLLSDTMCLLLNISTSFCNGVFQ